MGKFSSFVLAIIVLLIFPKHLLSQQEFFVDAVAEYRILNSGLTKVTISIELENAGDNKYATSYRLNLVNINPSNIKAVYEGNEIPATLDKSGDTSYLKTDFSDYIIGKGKKRKFSISFTNSTFASRTGEVWEISIPRLADTSFRSFSAELIIPESFGDLSFMSPQPSQITKDGDESRYYFSSGLLDKTGISAGFGKFQIFSFNVKYHLNNPENSTKEFSIALPPDTSFQKIYYQKIEPLPKDIIVDPDGNWIASYSLEKEKRLDVVVFGNVQIFSSPINVTKSVKYDLNANLQEQEYWEVTDESIQNIAKELKTPYEIYKFVSSHLIYDYSRVKPEVQRLGARGALENPGSAICMEFTDLFIAIARAAGIPAREVNGFAYTENPEIQPLSLVADVLHAWPEYWDTEKNIWVPIDPTWASTTGGVDYFNKLDLRHFTFVIHGQSSTEPHAPGSYKLGSNPQKDVFVTFGQLDNNLNQKLQITTEEFSSFPLTKQKLIITIINPGPSAKYDLIAQVYFDNQKSDEEIITTLLPYTKFQITTYIPNSLFTKNTPDEIRIVAGNSEFIFLVNKEKMLISNLIFIFFVSIIIILIFLHRLGKFRVIGIIFRLKSKL